MNKLGANNVVDYFLNKDTYHNGDIEASQVEYFFTSHQISFSPIDWMRFKTIFQSTPERVNYLKMLTDLNLIDEQLAESYRIKKEQQKKQTPLESFGARYREFCYEKNIVALFNSGCDRVFLLLRHEQIWRIELGRI